MGRMSDLDIVRQEHGLPTDTPLSTLVKLSEEPVGQLPSLSVDMAGEVEWGDWLEATYDPDNERLEDKEV